MRARVENCHRLPWLLCLLLVLAGCGAGAKQDDHVAHDVAPTANDSADRADTQQAPSTDSHELARSESAAPALEVPTEPEKTAPELSPSEAPPPAPLPASQAPLPQDRIPTAELEMPKVVFTKHHAELNKVGVGDAFPNLELPNRKGEQQALTSLLGPKLTVVVFWNGLQPAALEELSDLGRYYQPRFADKGLNIVAVNTGEAAQQAGELVSKSGASYPVLSDPDGAAFQQVATSKLPRTYLLDSSGKILWFDIEYSPTTRRDLAAVIRKTLGE